MKEKPVILASLGTAIAASLCCIAPLVAVILGLGAFGAASVFETFRPYLLGITFALLAGAFYLVYRPSKAEECVEGVCSVKPTSRSTKAVLWLATFLVVLFVLFPYYSGLVWKTLAENPASYAPTPSLRQSTMGLSTGTLEVSGMTCGGCAAAVNSALSSLKGVHKASVSFEQNRAVVHFDPSQVTLGQMKQAVEKAGYKAEVRP